jgi:uncharacterized protein (DUF1684 family)
MPRLVTVAAAIALVACSDATRTATPPLPSAAMIEPISAEEAEWNAWHEARIRMLAAPEGWLSLAGLVWLSDGDWTIGRKPGGPDDRRIELLHAPADECGTFVVAGEVVRFRPAPGTDATADERPIAGAITLVPDSAGTPTAVRFGPIAVTLVRRNGQFALRIRDRDRETRTRFAGIDRFPFDPSRRVEATFTPAEAGATFGVRNVTGFVDETPLAGELRFRLDGHDLTLLATGDGSGGLFVVFGDLTNGRSTYGGGRFLAVPAPTSGQTSVDFNRATNPPCSFTPFATCPTPVAANRLPLAIEAGERHGSTGDQP